MRIGRVSGRGLWIDWHASSNKLKILQDVVRDRGSRLEKIHLALVINRRLCWFGHRTVCGHVSALSATKSRPSFHPTGFPLKATTSSQVSWQRLGGSWNGRTTSLNAIRPLEVVRHCAVGLQLLLDRDQFWISAIIEVLLLSLIHI